MQFNALGKLDNVYVSYLSNVSVMYNQTRLACKQEGVKKKKKW